MNSHLNFYIDGAWVQSEGGTTHQVIDPSTEQPVTEITLGTQADVDKAVAAARLANATEYGLSAAISGDPAAAAKVAPRLRAGLVTINAWSGTIGTPFGGYKQSGNGREGGKYGIADFMELKTIVGEPA